MKDENPADVESQTIVFSTEDTRPFGPELPIVRWLFANSPSGGSLGVLRYYPPHREGDPILIARLEVEPECRRCGIGSALMDELQRKHPDIPIDHGDRTTAGEVWWTAYAKGKNVQRGRTR